MLRVSLREIGNFSSGMRLAASERPEILQIGSLAQGTSVIPGQSCKEEGFLELEAEPWGKRIGRPRLHSDCTN